MSKHPKGPKSTKSGSASHTTGGSNTTASHNGPSELTEEIRKAMFERGIRRSLRKEERERKIEELKNEGNAKFKQGLYSEAATLYNKAIERYKAKATLHSNLAAAYLKLELYDSAEEAATTTLTYEPQNIKARFRRGMARKEMGNLKAALVDFETVVSEDPQCQEAVTQMDIILEELLYNSDEDYDSDGSDCFDSESDYGWPYFDEESVDWSSDDSDSSDARHNGNYIPCRFYNSRDGCARGTSCRFSHAPDKKSVRDNLGKNVCIYFLVDRCKFKTKCVYSHSKACLSHGWWDHEEHVAAVQAFFDSDPKFGLIEDREFISFIKAMSEAHDGRGPLSTGAYAGPTSVRSSGKAKEPEPKPKPKPKPTPKATEPPPSNLKPTVMLLDFDNDGVFTSVNKLLYASLHNNARVLTAASSEDALRHLTSSSELSAVFVADAAITKRKYAALLTKLVEFARSGGSVVVGGLFSNFVRPMDMDKFFSKTWGLSWKSGSYHRTTFSLNQSHPLAKSNASLPKSISIKALHVKDITQDVALYSPTEDSKLQSLVFAPEKINDLSESPIAYTQIGKGHFGYVGDVNGEDGSVKATLAMLGLLNPPKPSPTSITNKATPSSQIPGGHTDTPPTSQPKQKSINQFVLILSLENEDFFESIHEHLLTRIRDKVEWKQALTAPVAMTMLASPDLVGVFVTDQGIMRKKNVNVLTKLVEFVKKGGSAVVGGLFSAFAKPEDINTFFANTWGLGWKSGSYHRTNFSVNPFHDGVKKNPSLEYAYSMTALYVGGVDPSHCLYLPVPEHSVRSITLTSEHTESPAVQAPIGKGYLGYIGDANAEVESTNVVLAMLGLLDTFGGAEAEVTSAPTATGTKIPKSIPEKTTRPFMMILSFKSQSSFTEQQSGLLAKLQEKLEVLLGLSNERVVDLLTSSDLVGILITDVAIMDPQNAYLLTRLVEYTKAGGTVVIGGHFSSHLRYDEAPAFFGGAWGLPWKVGDYTRTDVTVNQKHDLAKDRSSLSESFTVKALHLSGITPSTAVYVASKGSHIYEPPNKVTRAAVVHAKVGDGYLGYLGCVGSEESHTSIVLAMFRLDRT